METEIGLFCEMVFQNGWKIFQKAANISALKMCPDPS